jgi:lipoyl(octanoyl) transferase
MTFSLSTWRLIKSLPEKGAWNMALDEAILESVGKGDNPPTLRLYAWEPACLSLGYAQPYNEIDTTRLHQLGWEVVRRPTGGRAILHTDELTYSVTGPLDEPRLVGGVLESYRRISEALLLALHLLGVPAEAHENPAQNPAAEASPSNGNNASASSPVQPICFEVPSNYEITVGGKKLIGSAQARRKEGVLQHGSFPLWGDLTRITQVLVYGDETKRASAAERLLKRATTLENIIKQHLSWDEVAQTFCAAFEKALNVKLVLGEPTQNELERANMLLQEKYANSEWIQKN